MTLLEPPATTTALCLAAATTPRRLRASSSPRQAATRPHHPLPRRDDRLHHHRQRRRPHDFITQIFANHTGAQTIEEGSSSPSPSPPARLSPTSPPGTAPFASPPSSSNASAPKRSTTTPVSRPSTPASSEVQASATAPTPPPPPPSSAKMHPNTYGTRAPRRAPSTTRISPPSTLGETFTLPLQPSVYQKQSAKHFKLNFELHSAYAFTDLQILSKTLPLKFTRQDAQPPLIGTYEASDVTFDEDFSASWKLSLRSRHPRRYYLPQLPPQPRCRLPTRNQPHTFKVTRTRLLPRPNPALRHIPPRSWATISPYTPLQRHPLRQLPLQCSGTN